MSDLNNTTPTKSPTPTSSPTVKAKCNTCSVAEIQFGCVDCPTSARLTCDVCCKLLHGIQTRSSHKLSELKMETVCCLRQLASSCSADKLHYCFDEGITVCATHGVQAGCRSHLVLPPLPTRHVDDPKSTKKGANEPRSAKKSETKGKEKKQGVKAKTETKCEACKLMIPEGKVDWQNLEDMLQVMLFIFENVTHTDKFREGMRVKINHVQNKPHEADPKLVAAVRLLWCIRFLRNFFAHYRLCKDENHVFCHVYELLCGIISVVSPGNGLSWVGVMGNSKQTRQPFETFLPDLLAQKTITVPKCFLTGYLDFTEDTWYATADKSLVEIPKDGQSLDTNLVSLIRHGFALYVNSRPVVSRRWKSNKVTSPALWEVPYEYTLLSNAERETERERPKRLAIALHQMKDFKKPMEAMITLLDQFATEDDAVEQSTPVKNPTVSKVRVELEDN